MRVPSETRTAEIVVKRSRFIATAFPCGSFGELRQTIERTRKANPGARHTVHAAVIGTQFSASDDHEPKNTAGRPVLEVLKRSGLSNIGITVVRYFGGILLGTGGLVRAYTSSAQAALEGLATEDYVPRALFLLSVPYDLLVPVQRLLERSGAREASREFSDVARLRLEVPEPALPGLRGALAGLSGGSLVLEPLERRC